MQLFQPIAPENMVARVENVHTLTIRVTMDADGRPDTNDPAVRVLYKEPTGRPYSKMVLFKRTRDDATAFTQSGDFHHATTFTETLNTGGIFAHEHLDHDVDTGNIYQYYARFYAIPRPEHAEGDVVWTTPIFTVKIDEGTTTEPQNLRTTQSEDRRRVTLSWDTPAQYPWQVWEYIVFRDSKADQGRVETDFKFLGYTNEPKLKPRWDVHLSGDDDQLG